HHTFHIEVTEAVDTEVFADVFHRHLVRNQLIRIRKIDAVVTSKPVRRTAYAHVHFFGTSFAQGHYARSRGRPPHDRVVHNHDPFSSHHFLDQVQLYSHIEVADELARLQKRSANVVIADESVRIGNIQFLGKTERRIISGVRHRHDDVCIDRKFSCQFASHFHAHLADVNAADHTVRAREIDVF